MIGNGTDTFTRLDAKRREQTPQALARLVISSLFVGLWAIFWLARVPMPLPFLIALLLEVAFFVIYWRVIFILPNVRSVATAQYGMLTAEIVFHTTMVYFLGTLSWLGSFAYVFGLIFTNAFLDLRKGMIYTTGACAAFSALIVLEATGTVPHHEYLAQGALRYSDPRFVATTLVCATGVFYSIYLWSSWVGQQLRRERDSAIRAQDELLDARVELQRTNEELEQRVRARTVELEMANAALRDSEARVRTVITNAPIVLFALDRSGAFTLLEGKALETMNVEPQAIIGRSAFEVYANAPTIIEAVNQALAGERTTTLVPGGAFLLEAQLGPMHDDRGNIIGVIGVATDITERKRAEEALQQSEETLTTTIESTADGILVVAHDYRILYANRRFFEMWRIPDHLASTDDSKPLVDFVLDQLAEPEAFLASVQQLQQTGEEWLDVLNFKDNRTFERYARPFKKDDHVAGYVISFRDITERSQAENALRESEETLKSTIESTADGILVVNNAGQVVHTNQRFADMWRIPATLLATRDDEQLLEYVLSQLQEPEAFLSKVKELYESARDDLDALDFKDGRAFERYSRPLMLDEHVAGRVWSFRDVTERKQIERTLAEQAQHDPLTGLLNRRAGLAAIEDRLAVAKRESGRLAVFVLDLDKFKSINDSYSHEMGDNALIRVAEVLTNIFGERGVICRLGGDEFEIAVAGIEVDDAIDLGEQLRAALHRSLTSDIQERIPIFTASIGVACYPVDGDSAVELGRRADEAMYAGKAAGADTVRAWRPLKRDRAA